MTETESNATKVSQFQKKNFVIQYDPEQNKNNIYARKLQRELPKENQLFAENPFTKMMQPQDITKSKRFVKDRLNISDIPGAKPDVYKQARNIEGREYIGAQDIEGAQPTQLKQSKPRTGIDYKLYTKDINPEKWQTKRQVDPLRPQYEIATKSGRKMVIGHIEKSVPKVNISPQTKRIANYVADIDGTMPRRGNSITDAQREVASGKSNMSMYGKSHIQTRNTLQTILPNQINADSQEQLIQQTMSTDLPPPGSHYARFQSYQQTKQPPQPSSLQAEVNFQKPPLDHYSTMIKSSYRQKGNNQFHTQNNSIYYQNNQEMNSNSNPISKINLLNQVGSRRLNTYQLLQNQVTQNQTNSQGELDTNNNIYFNLPSKSEAPHQISSNPNLMESPEIKQRLWSKAKNMGIEIQQQNNSVRVSSKAQQFDNQYTNSTKITSLKANFNDVIFQKGIQLNNGNNSFIKSGYGQINPLSNEINRSADSTQFLRNNDNRNIRLAQRLNPITNEAPSIKTTNHLSTSQQNISPVQVIVPPTTQKAYGNFLNANQLDQMIKQLRSASNALI